ncbi:MAG: DUF4199 domain-containing protein [Verrucomicrobia bacterium]|nr:DUF4199 domain-containing protein [Cytophagales bacterium]
MENTNENAPTTARLAVKWGLILGLVSVIYTLIANLSGIPFNPSLSWITTIFSLAAPAFAIYKGMGEFKDTHEGFMSYGQGLGIGTMMSGVSGVLSSAFSSIYIAFIDPTFLSRMSESQKEQVFEQWEKQNIPEEQMETMWESTQQFTAFMQNPALLFLFGIIASIIGGFIISLIISAIQRKTKPEFS